MMSLPDKMVMELLRLGAYLQREGARMSREYGLSQQHYVVLVVINEHGPISQKAIMSDLLYEKSNVSKAISNLSALGLVETSRGAEDSRVVMCTTTTEGRNVVAQCMRTMRTWNSAWLRQVPDSDLEHAVDILRTIGPMEAI